VTSPAEPGTTGAAATPPATGAAATAAAPDLPVPRRWLTHEVWIVFALSLGASGVRSLLHLVADLTNGTALREQAAVLNGSQAPGQPWLDLALQLTSIGFGLVPVFLAAYLLMRSGESLRTLGLDGTRPWWDVVRGVLLAAVIGGAGVAFYLVVHATGANLTVVPENLPDVWWRYPVLVLSAAQNAILEEVLVAGYLLHRLRQLGWSDNRSLLVSAVLRGSYHLYQGFGGFAGNFVMGLVFGRCYQRWGRITPLVIAHTIMDTVAFVGYALLAGHVSWLPTP
jgi:membrane protease YdiL (CAAX protease family)